MLFNIIIEVVIEEPISCSLLFKPFTSCKIRYDSSLLVNVDHVSVTSVLGLTFNERSRAY